MLLYLFDLTKEAANYRPEILISRLKIDPYTLYSKYSKYMAAKGE